MTHDDLNGAAQLWALSILRAFADLDPQTSAGHAEIDELIADVHDRLPADSAPYLTANLAAIAATLLTRVADLTGETEHGLINLIELGYHPELALPTES